jgi:hypothetical protein
MFEPDDMPDDIAAADPNTGGPRRCLFDLVRGAPVMVLPRRIRSVCCARAASGQAAAARD